MKLSELRQVGGALPRSAGARLIWDELSKGEPLTAKQIQHRTGLKKLQVHVALRKLSKHGAIVPTEARTNGKSATWVLSSSGKEAIQIFMRHLVHDYTEES